ncbi:MULTISPECIES: T3SS effector HopA1 family protein [unclassified Microcoleus]|uniref:T3SS effector HopA1 family protein n=1 Tax=unclassified Microcoleus TaxID=2642155 RepID=UPI002FD2055A
MQLENFSQTQQPDFASQQLLDTLQDIVNNVQIHSNFCISHPNYKPLELPDEVVVRFQRMPADIQNKYLSLQLRSFLYGIYYNGSMRSLFAPDADLDSLALHQDLENNTRLGVDIAFYEQLHSCNGGTGYFDRGWYVVRQESDGTLAVNKGGLTLHIKPEKHLQLAENAAIGELVAIRMPRNLVQNGFYVAVGNAGLRSHSHPDRELEIVRIYFNFNPEGSVAVMESLTQQLNNISIPFHFKTLYNPGDYQRYDSGVLYFEKSHYEAVRQVLESVYAETKAHFNADVPLFTKFLAPGVGLAEEPDSKFADQESFGMNRCQIVANGLLEAWHSVDDSPEARMTSILKQFSLLGVELLRSYLNANSLDIYTQMKF